MPFVAANIPNSRLWRFDGVDGNQSTNKFMSMELNPELGYEPSILSSRHVSGAQAGVWVSSGANVTQ